MTDAISGAGHAHCFGTVMTDAISGAGHAHVSNSNVTDALVEQDMLTVSEQ